MRVGLCRRSGERPARPARVPRRPGVYRFRDRAGRDIYIGRASNLLLHFAVLNHALQDAGSPHQNVILLLLGHLESRRGLFLCPLKVTAIQVDIGGV